MPAPVWLLSKGRLSNTPTSLKELRKSMAAVTTERLMQLALDLVGWDEIPPDSAIYYPGARISHMLVGIDVGAGELFMARQLGFHAVIAHHPAGFTGPTWEVYRYHVRQMVAAGVPEDQAEAAVAGRVRDLQARAQMQNYDHVSSVAKMLEMPFLNVHAPLDELGRRIMQETIDTRLARQPSASVRDVREALLTLPAYRASKTEMLV